MKRWTFVLIAALLVLSMVLGACAPAATPEPVEEPMEEPAEEPVEEPTEAPMEEPAEPVDITLWAQATVTESGPPPDDWIAYEIIREELSINLEYVIVPPSGDGEAKLNAAAAANDLPDLFQIVSSTRGKERDNLYNYYDLGLLAPVDDMFTMMPERTKNHYSSQNSP